MRTRGKESFVLERLVHQTKPISLPNFKAKRNNPQKCQITTQRKCVCARLAPSFDPFHPSLSTSAIEEAYDC
ncbi:hypothetical protein L2E82_19715 [Cichorium intybus]|uniref:Uncharacterized protein n=1 Tax=Cichorium intybus TaxID=13427 RepID=A0ACB9FC26_CICIN|nr:hypothetical protein L2E82_19715 [Cichorium intybus]